MMLRPLDEIVIRETENTIQANLENLTAAIKTNRPERRKEGGGCRKRF